MDQLEVRVHEEIDSYNEKFYGLTLRNWLSVIITAVIDIPLYIFAKKYISEDILQIFIILISAPILGVGFISVQQLPLEKFARFFMRSYFFLNKPIAYRSDKEVALEKEYYEGLSFLEKIRYNRSRERLEKTRNKNSRKKTDEITEDMKSAEDNESRKSGRKERKINRKYEKALKKELKRQEKINRKIEKKQKKEENILEKLHAKEEKKIKKNKKETNHKLEVSSELEQNNIRTANSKGAMENQSYHEMKEIRDEESEKTIEVTSVSDGYESDDRTEVMGKTEYEKKDMTDERNDYNPDIQKKQNKQNKQTDDKEITANEDKSDSSKMTTLDSYDFDSMSNEQLGAMMRAFLKNSGGK